MKPPDQDLYFFCIQGQNQQTELARKHIECAKLIFQYSCLFINCSVHALNTCIKTAWSD